MKSLNIKEIKPGMKVVFIDHSLNVSGLSYVDGLEDSDTSFNGKEGVVITITDMPGKQVAVCMKEANPTCHSCDGMIPNNRGRWALASQLYTVEDYNKHKEAAAKHDDQLAEATKIIEEYLK